jgi:hypothetical protein
VRLPYGASLSDRESPAAIGTDTRWHPFCLMAERSEGDIMRFVLAVLLTSGLAAASASAGPHTSKPITTGPKTPKVSAKIPPRSTPSAATRAPRASAPKSTTTPKAPHSSPAVASKGRPAHATTKASAGHASTTTASRALPRNPKLVAKLQGMLPAGLSVDQAATGFRNQGQFIAAVNVSRNLGIPFVDLKTSMVNDGLSLGQTIQRLKPSANAEVETSRATRWANKQLEPR